MIQVVHPAPGNATGTLVNAILNHCSLPMVATSTGENESDSDVSDDEFSSIGVFSRVSEAPIRPGIVHRLDKGTSGLLVVAKVICSPFLSFLVTAHLKIKADNSSLVLQKFATQTLVISCLTSKFFSLELQDEHSHAHLSAQFKQHSIERVYISLTCGVPPSTAGRIEMPICRDPNNRIRMTAIDGTKNNPHAKYAASR